MNYSYHHLFDKQLSPMTGITDYNATEPVVMASKAITLTQHGYKPAGEKVTYIVANKQTGLMMFSIN